MGGVFWRLPTENSRELTATLPGGAWKPWIFKVLLGPLEKNDQTVLGTMSCYTALEEPCREMERGVCVTWRPRQPPKPKPLVGSILYPLLQITIKSEPKKESCF